MSARENEGLNGRDKSLASITGLVAGVGFPRRDRAWKTQFSLGFSPYLSGSVFAIFLLLHLWASLTAIDTSAAGVNDKVSHYLAFSWLGTILFWSIISFSVHWPERIRTQWIWHRAALALFLYGLAVEGLQNLIPHRQFEWLDVAANGAGIATVLILSLFARFMLDRDRHRKKRESRR